MDFIVYMIVVNISTFGIKVDILYSVMATYYDRYKQFRKNGRIMKIPSIEIETASTDLYITFNKNRMRLDNLSYKYYGDSNYGWLILMANPNAGSLEFDIPDKTTLRIPYPIDDALLRYENKVNEYLGSR